MTGSAVRGVFTSLLGNMGDRRLETERKLFNIAVLRLDPFFRLLSPVSNRFGFQPPGSHQRVAFVIYVNFGFLVFWPTNFYLQIRFRLRELRPCTQKFDPVSHLVRLEFVDQSQ